MLDIPNYIKDLLKRDNVLKNFRVKFPNGERADICNDQLIKESMKFEEHLVSRVPAKFGLCEANVISFQCVGVENIKRKRIHIQLEIDVSSLTSEQQSECGAITSVDVPFPYYVLHYGDFIVTECERDNNLGIRKVVGTSRGLLSNDEFAYSMNNACWYDKRKLTYFTYNVSKTANYFNLSNYVLLQGQTIFDKDSIGGAWEYISDDYKDYEKWGKFGTDGPNFMVKPKNPSEHTYVDEDGYCLLSINTEIYKYDIELSASTADDPLFEVGDLLMVVPTDTFRTMAENTWNTFIDYMERTYYLETMWEFGTGLKKWDVLKNFIYNLLHGMMLAQYWNATDQKTNPSKTTYTSTYDLNSKFLPMDSYLMAHREMVAVPDRIDLCVEEFTTPLLDPNPATVLKYSGWTYVGVDFWQKLYKFTSQNITLFPANMIAVTTQQVKIGNTTRYSPTIPIININAKNTLQDIVELKGKFGGMGRLGVFREYSLFESNALLPSESIYPSNSLYPSVEENSTTLQTDEFISALYDEYLFYYKGIYVMYKDTNNEDAEYQLLFDENDDNPDMPYYNLSSNSIISTGKFTEEQLVALIAPLVTALRKFRYYQSDVQMRALPYIEIGDTLFIRTKNGTIVMPVLMQTITGIQDLRAKIVSR